MANVETNGAYVRPSPIHQLSIGTAFNGLTEQEKHYAHYMSRFVVSNLVMFTIFSFR